jgi:tRNA (mo5U34)-methyltransferase
MRILSGETLSLIADSLQRLNSGELDAAACGQLITSALARHEAFVDLSPAPAGGKSRVSAAREQALDAAALARLNTLLPWTSFNALAGGRRLGSAWSASKRSQAQPLPDTSLAGLNTRIPLRGLSVLEAGCYEGHHTVSLAHYGAEVWAFDARIENVIKTLVKLWAFGLERSTVVNLIDIEGAPVREQLARLGRNAPFDLVHHRGVLYHLTKPVEHLVDVASLCSRHVYLHTHVAKEDQVNETHKSELGEFPVFVFSEPGERSFAPFAGMTSKAVWLTRDSLMRILKDLGLPEIQVLSEREERHGLRIELIASRGAP